MPESVTMPLDPYAKRLLGMIAAAPPSPERARDPMQLRESIVRLAEAVDVKGVEVAAVESREIGGERGMRVRLYTPFDARPVTPALVYFHGGMGVYGDLGTHDGLCRLLANSSGCRVVSAGYRLAPEHPFPAALEDVRRAVRWTAENAGALGIDSDRLAVGGDSHGATLAAVLCQTARMDAGPPLALQLLLCPVTDLRGGTPSWRAFGQGYLVDRGTLEWAIEQYCAPGTDLADPRVSPLCASDFAGLPPAHVHTAEFDPFRDEGRAYADALAAAGVDVRYSCHEGMIHHFYAMAGAIPKARAIVEAAGAAVREALG